MEREKLGSRLGFILLSAGCAIGIGNVWKFPYMTGQYGGGAFVVLYLFFHNFSTFLGRAGLYLEDLFVLPEYRGKGYGKAILKRLAHIAVERGCGRLEWACLDWNRPSIDFYLSLGAVPMEEWTTYRVTGDTLQKLAE